MPADQPCFWHGCCDFPRTRANPASSHSAVRMSGHGSHDAPGLSTASLECRTGQGRVRGICERYAKKQRKSL